MYGVTSVNCVFAICPADHGVYAAFYRVAVGASALWHFDVLAFESREPAALKEATVCV